MKKFGTLLLFISMGLLMAIGITKVVALSLNISLLIAAVVCVLFYLMLDTKPEINPGDATIIRLTRGSWQRRR